MSSRTLTEKQAQALALVEAARKQLGNLASLPQKVACFALSLASRGVNNERAPEETVAKRYLSCFGHLPLTQLQVAEPCPAKVLKGERSFCSECGCGEGAKVALDGEGYTKLHYPWLFCPRKREGFSNHEPCEPTTQETSASNPR